jgi:hypothetical protein
MESENDSSTPPSSTKNPSPTDHYRSFIISGEYAGIGMYPYVVLIRNKAAGHKCTGTILDNRHVLTAAHCIGKDKNARPDEDSDIVVFPPNNADLQVFAAVITGSKDSKDYQPVGVEAAYIHSLFPDNYDIAVMRLKESLRFSDDVQPVCLASPTDRLPDLCELVGYGDTENKSEALVLKHADNLPWMDNAECVKDTNLKNFSQFLVDKLNFKTTAEQYAPHARRLLYGRLCYVTKEDKKSVCHGDSGGPLICSMADNVQLAKQFGVSNSFYAKTNDNCGEVGSWQLAASTQVHIIWVEFAALPVLANVARQKEFTLNRFTRCIDVMNWTHVASQNNGFFRPPIKIELKKLVCRFFTAYEECLLNNRVPSDCYFLDVGIMPHFYDSFENLRCQLFINDM